MKNKFFTFHYSHHKRFLDTCLYCISTEFSYCRNFHCFDPIWIYVFLTEGIMSRAASLSLFALSLSFTILSDTLPVASLPCIKDCKLGKRLQFGWHLYFDCPVLWVSEWGAVFQFKARVWQPFPSGAHSNISNQNDSLPKNKLKHCKMKARRIICS